MAALEERRRRINQELKQLKADPPPGISIEPVDNNLFKWIALIVGPFDTPFEDGLFKLTLEFPKEYPKKPPKATFVSDMFHPNVYKNNQICIDILQEEDKWSSEYTACTVLVAIQVLLGEPNPESPANSEANNLFKADQNEYLKRVKKIVEMSLNTY